MNIKKIRISKDLNIYRVCLTYLFLLLYLQLLDLILPFTLTTYLFVLFLALIIAGVCKRRIKIFKTDYIIIFVGLVYIILYRLYEYDVFSYVYPAVIVMICGKLLVSNDKKYIQSCKPIDWTTVEKATFYYLVINLAFALIRINGTYQIVGSSQQFKGVLPHSNMFGSIMMSLYVLLYSSRSKLSKLDKLFIVVLTILTLSRTYIAIIALLLLFDIIQHTNRKVPLLFKIFLVIVAALLFGEPIFEFLVNNISAFSRFRIFGLGGNGRQLLSAAYYSALKGSGFLGYLVGIPVTIKYMSLVPVQYYGETFVHSFAENSYISIFLLFGILGLLALLSIIVRILRLGYKNAMILPAIVILLSIFTQDSLLSTETGLLLWTSILCAILRQEGEHRKTRLCKAGHYVST